jgi:hypothetical protein
MSAPDLDAVIRRLAKGNHRVLMQAAKARRDHFLALAAKAKDKVSRARHKQAAKDAMEQGESVARRLRTSAANAADSYARAMKKAMDEARAVAGKRAEAKPKKKAAKS